VSLQPTREPTRPLLDSSVVFLAVIDRILLIAALTLLFVAPDLAAQDQVRCEAGRIATINIVRRPVFDERSNGTLSKFYTAANWLHTDTRERVIRRELLFQEGDCVDALRLSESERLLRRFRFLESASVVTARRDDGDVDVTVVTQDDWTIRFEPRFSLGGGLNVTGIVLAERNLAGRGSTLEFLYIDRSGRDDVGGGFFDPQFLGSRWDLAISAVRIDPGWTVDVSLAYPFLGLVGRRAAFQNTFYSDRWFPYVVPDSSGSNPELSLPTTQKLIEIGGARRRAAGRRNISIKQATYGLTLSYEQFGYGTSFYSDSLAEATLDPIEALADSLPSGFLRPRKTLRLNLVLGFEGLRYVQRRGVSTLRSREDVAIGGSADVILGLAGKAFGTTDSHLLIGVDLYSGARIRGDWFSLLRMNGEVRQDFDAQEWRDAFATLEWTNFFLMGSSGVTEVTARFSGGWETSVPFQLTLGGPWGLTGFAPDRFPGGARLAVSIENRYHLFEIGKLLDLGSAAFVEAGEMWANGAAFGVDSGLQASAGLGLRLATPTGSRTTYRLQAGVPITSGVGLNDVVFTLRIDRLLRLEDRPTDPQVARSRDPAIRSAGRYFK
jgi:hypothetical protein